MVRGTVQPYPLPWESLWPDPESGPWKVTLKFAVVEGRAECVGWCVDPVDKHAPTPVTAQLVRQEFKIGELVSRARAERRTAAEAHIEQILQAGESVSADHVDPETGWPMSLSLHGIRQVYEEQRDEYTQHRVRKTKEFYADVAHEYNRARQAGDPPTASITTKWNVPRSTAAWWVREARRRGLLSPTTRGRASGSAPNDQQEET